MTIQTSGERERDVVLSFKIEADRTRVFYALSVPEYIEAWLLAPGAEDSLPVFSLITRECFCIDLYQANSLRASVQCSCHVVSADHIQYAWTQTSAAGAAETLVDIQLVSASDGCVLGLKHNGLKDTIESAWYCKMWNESLEKLCNLVRKN
jgi:uncharacterized protein YndB with AHSA1/START domain